ncbi:MAG: purine nucleoside permease [Rhizobiales bacterium]|nr:purine nucleoside permease [Hyphomicrobiales bacterium]
MIELASDSKRRSRSGTGTSPTPGAHPCSAPGRKRAGSGRVRIIVEGNRTLKAAAAAFLPLAACLWAIQPAAAQDKTTRITPEVLVVTMFEVPGDTPGEAQRWIENEKLTTRIAIPGLSKAFPDLLCNAEGLCLVTTSMGYANAASSISALVLSDELDLSHTYILIAGIAGVDPADGTLGSAHWARYAIDGGLQWQIDGRQIPKEWSTGQLGIFSATPKDKPKPEYGTEVFHLNEALAQNAYDLSKDVKLEDSEEAKKYRAHYPDAPANQPPAVSICDTVSSDTWWSGSLMSRAMNDWAKLMTDGAANYCTTQQEDNATLTALSRGADMGRIDMKRVALLRTASDFDQEYPGQTPEQSLHAKTGAFIPSVENAYLVGSRLTHAIVSDWPAWKDGVPAN